MLRDEELLKRAVEENVITSEKLEEMYSMYYRGMRICYIFIFSIIGTAMLFAVLAATVALFFGKNAGLAALLEMAKITGMLLMLWFVIYATNLSRIRFRRFVRETKRKLGEKKL